MAEYTNASTGSLIMPDGTHVAVGENVALEKGAAGSAGVAAWIKGGKLTAAPMASKSAKGASK